MTDITIKNQFDLINDVTKDPEQVKRVSDIEILELMFTSFKESNNTKNDYETLLILKVEPLMKQLNKYEKQNIKPLKDILNKHRTIILDYERETTKRIKDLKKSITEHIEKINYVETVVDKIIESPVDEIIKSNYLIISGIMILEQIEFNNAKEFINYVVKVYQKKEIEGLTFAMQMPNTHFIEEQK